jgi:hypothetical protein
VKTEHWEAVAELPREEEGGGQVVEDVDDDVVVGDGVDLRPRELAVDQNPLHHIHSHTRMQLNPNWPLPQR